jgi:probable F420-dependent oxidoreductase
LSAGNLPRGSDLDKVTRILQGIVAMKFGAAIFFTNYSISPTALAPALEERGFDSLWCPEHSHIPLSRDSEWPQQGELPKKYYDVMDPFITLSQAAAVTKTLKVGTGICLVPQRDPIQTAKEIASLDTLSDGRFLFGVGSGWNADELANHGTEFKSRHKVLEERVAAMRVIWSQSKPEYHGNYVNFDPMMTWPKPVQQPGPAVYIGGEFPYGARRALAFGDGWLPHANRPDYDLLDKLPEFHEMESAAGRTPGSMPVTVFGPKEESTVFERYVEAGVERIVLNIVPMSADETLPILDKWAKLIEAIS